MNDHEDVLSVAGKVALVTDMASPMGYAIAEALVKAGAQVHGVNPDHDRCAEQVRTLRRWGKASGFVVDLRNGMSAAQLAHLINEELPRLHLVVSTSRIAVNESSENLIPGIASDRTELLGEMAFVQDLLGALSAAGSAVDPARVVLVGQFSSAERGERPEMRAGEAVMRLGRQNVNLNLIDIRPSANASMAPVISSVLSALMGFLSSSAAQRRGEIVEVNL